MALHLSVWNLEECDESEVSGINFLDYSCTSCLSPDGKYIVTTTGGCVNKIVVISIENMELYIQSTSIC